MTGLSDRGGWLTGEVIGAAIEVHRRLGPGLLESAYRRCLVHELRLRGHRTSTEVPVELAYKGLVVESAYRLDLVADDRLVVEVKAVSTVLPIHEAQLLTYLRLTSLPLGLLINFHVQLMKDGNQVRDVGTRPLCTLCVLCVSVVNTGLLDGLRQYGSDVELGIGRINPDSVDWHRVPTAPPGFYIS